MTKLQQYRPLMTHTKLQVMRRCNTVRALFPFPITQAPGDLLEAPLQEGLQHAKEHGLCPPGCRVVVMAENLADGPDTLPVLFTRVCPSPAAVVLPLSVCPYVTKWCLSGDWPASFEEQVSECMCVG